MKNLLNLFSEKNNDNYSKALAGLINIKKRFDGFMISFPDVTPNEIMLIKETWETLPKAISKGVKIMALGFIGNSKSLITSYSSNAYIVPHKHKDEYEHGLILKGKLIDRFANVVYSVGDTYTFEPNQIHYLSSDEGCLVYSQLNTNSSNKLIPLPKKLISRLVLA